MSDWAAIGVHVNDGDRRVLTAQTPTIAAAVALFPRLCAVLEDIHDQRLVPLDLEDEVEFLLEETRL